MFLWYHSTRTDSSFSCVSSHQARHARTRLSLFQSSLRVSLRMIHNTYALKADPAADSCTTVPPETDVHVQGLSHRRLSGRDTAPRRTTPSLQLPSPSLVEASIRQCPFNFTCLPLRRIRGEGRMITQCCGDCRLRHHASCQVPRLSTATSSVLQVQRWVLTCDAARRASCW